MAAVNILIAIILQVLLNWKRKKVTYPALASRSFQCFLDLFSNHHYWWPQQLRFNTFLSLSTEKIERVAVELVSLLRLLPSFSLFSTQHSRHLTYIRPHPSPEWTLQRLNFTWRIKPNFVLWAWRLPGTNPWSCLMPCLPHFQSNCPFFCSLPCPSLFPPQGLSTCCCLCLQSSLPVISSHKLFSSKPTSSGQCPPPHA